MTHPKRPRAASPGGGSLSLKSGSRRRRKREVLRTLSDIRRYFHRNETPYYFISATNFNLLNIHEWVRNFRFINYIDCFDGQHPSVFVPRELPHEPFESLEDINNYLLQHKEVVDYIKRRGPGGKALFLFFNEKTEVLCRELGLEVCFPPARLREEVDNKINTTRIGNRARVQSVPNVMTQVQSYEQLRKASRRLGEDVVVQTAFGDSGHTTFFISTEKDFDRHADEIIGQGVVKIMKRIRCRGSALEACVTRHGTIVGPLMTELVGFKELTPYRGGWCGNEVFPDAFSRRIRNSVRRMTMKIGDELRKMGYRGYFEIDFLRDLDTGKIYMGEINPRVTGASSMTNLAAFAHADAPLILFHLLEWADVDYELVVEAINDRWAEPENIDAWSQLVMKHTADSVDRITSAPRSGVWRMADDGSVHFAYVQTHRRTVEREQEGFFLRIAKDGDYRYEGADLGILITPGRLMDDDYQLTPRAKAWIRGLRAHYQAVALTPAQRVPAVSHAAEVGGFKML